MKNIGDGKHSIEDNMRDARSKWKRLELAEPCKFVITMEGRTKDPKKAVAEIKRRLHPDEVAIVFDQTGEIVKIKK